MVMKLYPVVLIAQLKLAKTNDPYKRKRPDHPGLVEIENITLNLAGIKTHSAAQLANS